MKTHTRDVQALTSDVRHLFHLLGEWGNAIHAGTGVNASLRAMMEALILYGPATVPDIARAKSVSRQHIQTIMDQLLALGLVEAQANPRHQRSPVFALTRAGEKRLDDMRRREAPFWDGLANAVSPQDVRSARRALTALRAHALAVLKMEEESNDDDRRKKRTA